MGLTEAQAATVNGLDDKGLHLNTGVPCECGPDGICTHKKRAFSDSMIYKHRCRNCGQQWETWSEG